MGHTGIHGAFSLNHASGLPKLGDGIKRMFYTGRLLISGVPHPATFRSRKVSPSSMYYNLTWDAQSYTPIEQFELYYRKLSSPEPGALEVTSNGVPRSHDRDREVNYRDTGNFQYRDDSRRNTGSRNKVGSLAT